MRIRVTWNWLLQLLLLVAAWALTGCGNTPAPQRAGALHVHIYCMTSDGKSLTCDPQDRISNFNTFVKDALYRPGSTFTIWAVGDRSGSRRFFTACIPDHWEAPVSQKKADFLRMAREGAAGNRPGLTAPAGCRPGPRTPPGVTKLVVFQDASPIKSDFWQTLTSANASGPIQHHSLVCDRSPSTLAAVCTPGSGLRVFDLWVTESLLRPGSTFSVEMVGKPRDTPDSFFQLAVPADMPVEERISFVLGARVELSRRITASGDKFASTIFETVSAAARLLHERSGMRRLTILSDGLQISFGPGGFNFEKTIPQQKAFLAWIKKNGLAADLKDIPVLVFCGLPTGQSGPVGALQATRVRDLWQKAFQSLGAPDVKLFTSCEAALAS